ncbi:TIGR02444 family protein [Halomonas sp. ANAO-440]|uniref:TIGR02444 family protein n=1 Tax=Halomonas sp. ANAO-440 TaxID=2861360 RepID=UPI001CAA5181|nr:TIGR02444 family protein [Halomonas sp. ANAO-440]MBZ0332355.1 TIGR02444 family protein [Halomonas sp. ANAO-440]
MSVDSTRLERALRSRLAADPLWDFALALYTRPGVETACLALQDEAGVDVCELLWHCWLHHHGLALEAEPDELAAIRRWQREVTSVLRALRRQLKGEAEKSPGVAEVRQQVQRAELAAEQETLARLQALAERGEGLVCQPTCRSKLAFSLASRWQLQKKAQLLALQTIESQLDPP